MKKWVNNIAFIGLLLSIILLSSCGVKATFTFSPSDGAAPLQVSFLNTSSQADEYNWDFGDGTVLQSFSLDEPVQHEYTKAGSYTVGLTVKKGESATTSISENTVTVTAGSLSQVVLEPASVVLDIGENCLFTATGVDSYGNEVAGNTTDWNSEIGTINAGSFTAGSKAGVYSEGIAATYESENGTQTGYASITINPGSIEKLTISTTEVIAGKTAQLAFVAEDAHGNIIEGLNGKWGIGAVYQGSITEDGLLTAGKKTGEIAGIISVEVTDGDKIVTATGNIIVVPGTLTQIGIAPQPVQLGIGMEQQMVAIGADQYGNRILNGVTYTWRSLTDAGSISDSGMFIASMIPRTIEEGITVEVSSTEGISIAQSVKVTILPDRIIFLSDRHNPNGSPEWFIMNVDGTDVKQLTYNTIDIMSGSCTSPDGRRIIYTDIENMYLTNTDGSWNSLLSSGFAYREPSFSPDGRTIAFQSWEHDPPEIYTIDVDGGNLQRITDNNWYDDYPTWSPAGNKIAFNTDRDGNYEIYLMNPDGSQQERLTSDTTLELIPRWSPVSNDEIVITSDRHLLGTLGIFILNPWTKGISTVHAVMSYHCIGPDWSPDGSQIVFYSDKDNPENRDIYIINKDGQGLRRLTDTGWNLYPHFLPRTQGVTVTESSVVIPDTSDSIIELRPQELTARVQNSIVRITTDLGSGSGFIIDPSGIVITNNHVVNDAKEITVYLNDGSSQQATILARDLVHDIAVIKINKDKLQALLITDIGNVSLGQQVIVTGFALGKENLSVTSGLVSSVEYDTGRNITWVQTDSAINAGNSGGPLLDMAGNVIGMVSSKLVGVSVEGIGFAISANTINTFLPRLLKGESIYSFE